MKAYRAAFVLGVLPLALYAYACSSDETGSGDPTNDGGTTQGSDATTDDEDSGPTKPVDDKDSGGDTPDAATDEDAGEDAATGDADIDDAGDAGDAADAAPVDLSCVGNPLAKDSNVPDGGFGDAGLAMDGGALRELIVTTPGDPHPPYFVGPAWVNAVDGGALAVSQLNNETGVVLVGPDGGAATMLRKAPANSFALGNAFDKTQVLTAVSSEETAGTSAIYRTSLDGGVGTTTTLAKTYNPTGLVIGPANNLYFTDPQFQHNPSGTSGLFRIAPNGTVTPIQSFDANNVRRYNYVAISGDQKTLYVSQTDQSKDLWKFPVSADGSVGAPTKFADATDYPVGLAVDNGGNVWVAELSTLGGPGGRVEVYAPTGARLGFIPINGKRPSSVAFGGADGKTVYVTAEETIFAYPTRCAGVR